MLKIASGLFVIYQVVDGGVRATDGARVAMTNGNGTELHGLGIEGEQTVRQQFANTREILQCLCGLDGAEHTCDGSKDTSLRTSRNGSSGRRLLEHTTVAGCAWQVSKRLTVEPQDATMRERLARHHTCIVDEKLHGEVVRAIDDEVVFLNNIERVR